MRKTIQTPAFQNLYNEFESFVKVRNYKQGKGKMYQSVVLEFLMWLEENGITKIKDVSSEISIQYFEYLTLPISENLNSVLTLNCFLELFLYLSLNHPS